jgi:hypothetical protein
MAEFRVTGAATAATVTPSAVLFGGSIRMAMAAADDQDKCTGKSSRLTIVSFPHQPCLPAVRGLILLVSTFEETDQSPLLYWWWRSTKWFSPPLRCRNSNKRRHDTAQPHKTLFRFLFWRAHIRFFIDRHGETDLSDEKNVPATPSIHREGRGICFDGVDVESNNTLLLYHPKQWRRLRRR